jgi:hypothetical protein
LKLAKIEAKIESEGPDSVETKSTQEDGSKKSAKL